MLRLVVKQIPRRGRYGRFWVPSLEQIEKSVRLLGAVDGASNVEVERVAELIRRVRVGDTNKSSAPARLKAADSTLLPHLRDYPAGNLDFLDIGCSDGTTSLDTVQRLESALGVRAQLHLMDRYIWIQSRKGLLLTEYLTSDGRLVMVRSGRLALAPAPKDFVLARLTNRLVGTYIGLKGLRGSLRETGKFPLLSPHVLANPDNKVYEGSILMLNPQLVDRMDVVRVSNLLHTDYFTKAEIQMGLDNAVRYVRDGGFLLVSRSHLIDGHEVERGTLWRRQANVVCAVADFGGGSEVKSLVQQVVPGGL